MRIWHVVRGRGLRARYLNPPPRIPKPNPKQGLRLLEKKNSTFLAMKDCAKTSMTLLFSTTLML